jgi:membrane fusion protein (multidrug efflux system)
MSRRRLVFTVIGALIAVFILYHIVKAVYIYLHGGGKHQFPPVPVQVATAQKQMWQDQIQATGTISAIEGVMVKSEIAGRITKIYFTSGTDVKKGDPLFQIYPDILEAQLSNNQAALQLAQVNYNRAVALYQKRVISEESLDEYTTQLQQAQANLDQTKANLVQHNIVAPFSGRIGLKFVDVGDYVNAGADLVDLQQMDPLRVQYSVPDRYISQLAIGDQAEIAPSSTPNTVYMGTVYAFEAAVDPSTRSFSMWAKIPNPNEDLVPGTYADITMFVGKPKPIIAIPQTGALYSPQGEYVFKVVDGKAVKTGITAGMRKDDLIEVTQGLQAGDVVVTAGQIKLVDGSPVVPTPVPTYPAAQPSKKKVITSTATNNADSPEHASPLPPTTTNKPAAAPAATTNAATPANTKPAAAPTTSAPAANVNKPAAPAPATANTNTMTPAATPAPTGKSQNTAPTSPATAGQKATN